MSRTIYEIIDGEGNLRAWFVELDDAITFVHAKLELGLLTGGSLTIKVRVDYPTH